MAGTEQTGPRAVVEHHGTTFTLVGTAHVSKASADEVSELIRSGEYDAVALELCDSRYENLSNPDRMASMDLFQVIREGRAGMVAANLAMSAFQQRVAEQSGIEPGAEMRAALHEAEVAGLPVSMVDRDIGTTLKRVWRNVSWWQRMQLGSGLFASLITRETVSPESIEQLKEGDVLESTFAEFAEQSEKLYEPLITERDRYMALRLMEDMADKGYRNVLVVIGAGHLKGLRAHLEGENATNPAAEREALDTIPPGSRFFQYLPWIVAALVIAGFAIGFSRDTELGIQLVTEWFLINGVLSALGSAIALAHPLTIIATFLAAPLTSLNPTIGAGFVAAGVELLVRRPKVEDFSNLKHDVANVKGWWHNRVSRTLMIFILASVGSAAGTYIAGFRIFDQLVGG
ncbi:pheromone shutdown-related protein TraB [Halospina denitrificans]|uniref:Pheromone shutdown-related protein TraB n=1 Tax=Halospina denitrificans TaxID=332522 RepID=A0A4R7K021_9GAMM|nr:TraB/GumN family protein [Halospina denitrificans]TDT43183.1 pheromone shutdown-related protein TraB [Halospina denitrificans]